MSCYTQDIQPGQGRMLGCDTEICGHWVSARFSFHDGNVGRTGDHPITTLQHTDSSHSSVPSGQFEHRTEKISSLIGDISDTSSQPHITTLNWDFHSKLLTGSGFGESELFFAAEFFICEEGERGKGEGFKGIYWKNSFQVEIDLSSFFLPLPLPAQNKSSKCKKKIHPVNIFYCGLQFSELTCNWAVTSMVSTKTGELIVLPQADPGLLFVCLVSRIKTKGRRHFMKGENNESCEFLLWCLHDLSQSVLPSQSMLPCLSFWDDDICPPPEPETEK